MAVATGQYRGFKLAIHDKGIMVITFDRPDRCVDLASCRIHASLQFY